MSLFLQIFIAIVFLLILSAVWASYTSGDYRTADRSSIEIAPNPADEKEAIVQIYAARAFAWRKVFSLHMWIATKEKNADFFNVYQVIGWRLYRGLSPVSVEPGIPDRRWFGSDPKILLSLKGEKAEEAIPKIKSAALSYPYPNQYRAWPGPNSNTFISHLVRNTPEIAMELPPDALGKDWLGATQFFTRSESGKGFQISFWGVLGLIVGLNEGIEFNLLGMSFGVDFLRPALKLPFIGRIGFTDRPF